MTKKFSFILIALHTNFHGCNESTSPPSATPSDSGSRTIIGSSQNRGGEELGKILIENLGVAGTIASDYEESLKYLSEPSSLQKSSASFSPVDKLTEGMQDAMASGRAWKNTKSWHMVDPPKPILRYLIFCRIVRNASHVKDQKCQNAMVKDAVNLISFDTPILFPLFHEICSGIKLSESCEEFALVYSMADSIIDHFVQIIGIDGNSLMYKNFVQMMHGQIREYNNCPSDGQKLHYQNIHQKSFNVVKAALEPPPEGRCLEEHIQAVLAKWIDTVSSDLTLLNCDKRFSKK